MGSEGTRKRGGKRHARSSKKARSRTEPVGSPPAPKRRERADCAGGGTPGRNLLAEHGRLLRHDAAEAVLEGGVRAVVEEEPAEVGVPGARGLHERRAVAVAGAAPVDVDAVPEEELRGRGVFARDGLHEQGAAELVGDSLDGLAVGGLVADLRDHFEHADAGPHLRKNGLVICNDRCRTALLLRSTKA